MMQGVRMRLAAKERETKEERNGQDKGMNG